MKNFALLLMGAMLTWACGNTTETPTQTAPTTQQQPAAKKPQPTDFPLLSEKNVVEVLRQYGETQQEDTVMVVTSLGTIKILLYKGVPLHRANFLMLAQRKYYDGTLFYRVIQNFMVQGGGTDDFKIKGKQRKIGRYTLPAEFQPERYLHKRGAVSMAREYEDNPEKRSVSYDFFIIQGTRYTQQELEALAKDEGFKLSSRQREVYTTIGGAPHLDGQHTVFGEVVEGMDVVDKIAAVPVGKGDWPVDNVRIERVEMVRQN